MSLGVIRLEAQPLAEAGNGLINSLGVQVRESDDKVRGCVIRMDAEHFTEFPQTTAVITLLHQDNTQVETGDGIGRLQFHRLLQVGNRPINSRLSP